MVLALLISNNADILNAKINAANRYVTARATLATIAPGASTLALSPK